MSEIAVAESTSAGTILRQAREAAGLHADTLAATLKVPVRKLEALEEDRYDLLGDAVFVRALASSVCRTLKLDPQPVLERLPQTTQPRLVHEGEGLNAPFRAPSDGPGPSVLDQVSRPTLVAVAVLVLGAVVLMFLPMVQRGVETVMQANAGADPVRPPPPAATGLVTGAPAEPPAQAPAAVAQASPGVAPVAMPPGTAPAAPSALTPAGLPQVAAAPAAAQPGTSPATPAAETGSGPINARGVVLFRTRGPSWIQVTDATGATVFRKLMEPGESAGASGTPPLAVTVGSVEATEVQVRGKPYDLGPVSKDNVARFEVK